MRVLFVGNSGDNMDEPQATVSKTPMTNRFAGFAAVFSVCAPLIVVLGCVFLFEFLRSHGHTNLTTIGLIGSFALLLPVIGLISGIVALVMAKRKKGKSIFVGSLVGILFNARFLVCLIGLPFVLPLMTSHKYPTTPQGRMDNALKELSAASSDQEKFYALDDAAKKSFNVGKIQDAENYANQLLKMAPGFQGNWNYGNAIQDGNLVLGRVAVREGRIENAKAYLLEAGKSPGSPSMDSFGPNMSLAKDLLEKSQRDTVLQYFDLCRKFWKMDYGKLDQWNNEVKAGKVPDFGANLVY